jgi:predicted HTH transcriptional regulator
MNWEEILDYFQEGETSDLAFITTIENEKDLGPALVAFANKPNGGIIFLGIDLVNYHLIGTDVNVKWVESLIKNFCSPIFNVQIEVIERNDKKVMFINVPEGTHKPYTFLRKIYLRDEKNIRLASLEEEQTFSQNTVLKVADYNLMEPKFTEPSAEITDEVQIELTPINEEITADNLALDNLESDNLEPMIESIKTTDLMIDQACQVIKKSLDHFNQRQRKTLTHVQQNYSIKNKEYRTLFGVSHKTAHLELIQLVAEGFLISKGAGRNTCYVFNSSAADLMPEKQTVLNFANA